MEKDLITVVIPVYRTQRYLERCIRSVAEQTYRKLQILLIDDGSPDNCPAICDKWAEKEPRITVIHKKNAGLGMARNTGLEAARGAYVCFLDSDDYLAPQALALAWKAAKRERADAVVFGFVNVDAAEKELSRRVPKMDRTVYRGAEIWEQFLPRFLEGNRKMGLFPGVCWSLFSMEAVGQGNWRFPSERDVLCEDICALLELYRHVDTVAVLPMALYHYRRNDASLSHSYRPDRFEKAKCCYGQLLKIAAQYPEPAKIVRSCGEVFLSQTIAAMKQESDLRDILNDETLQQVLRQTRTAGWKRRLLSWAMERKAETLCRLLLALQKGKERMG